MNQPKPRNRSLVAKSSARLAAAQLLYRVAVTSEKVNPAKLASDYEQYLRDNEADPRAAALPYVPPDKAYLKKLLEGVYAHREALDAIVDQHLGADWKRERISPLILAILTLGSFELDAFRTLAPAVLVDEYTSLAKRFFDADEVSFVHAALYKMAQFIRG